MLLMVVLLPELTGGQDIEAVLCQVAVLHCVLHNYVSSPAIFLGCCWPTTNQLAFSFTTVIVVVVDRLEDDLQEMMITDLTTTILSLHLQSDGSE